MDDGNDVIVEPEMELDIYVEELNDLGTGPSRFWHFSFLKFFQDLLFVKNLTFSQILPFVKNLPIYQNLQFGQDLSLFQNYPFGENWHFSKFGIFRKYIICQNSALLKPVKENALLEEAAEQSMDDDYRIDIIESEEYI